MEEALSAWVACLQGAVGCSGDMECRRGEAVRSLVVWLPACREAFAGAIWYWCSVFVVECNGISSCRRTGEGCVEPFL
jgi:hypothetical protein